MRRTLVFAVAALSVACRSQPESTPTPPSSSTPQAAAPAESTGPATTPTLSPAAARGQEIARNAARNLSGLEGALVETMTWCTFHADQTLFCGYGGEGGRTDGRWTVEAGAGWAKMTGTGDRPFEWIADYASENVVHFEEGRGPLTSSIYCDGKRRCALWDGPLVGIRDASGANPAVGKVTAALGKTRPEWFEDNEIEWVGSLAVVTDPAKSRESGSKILYRKRFERDATNLAASIESHVGQVALAPISPEEPYDIVVVVGDGMTKPPRLRVAIKDGRSVWVENIRRLATDEKFVGVIDGLAKERREYTEVWYVAGKESDAEEIRRRLSDFLETPETAAKKWEWGGDFHVLVVAGETRLRGH